MASIKRPRPEDGETSAPASVFPPPRFPQPHPAMAPRSFDSIPGEVGIPSAMQQYQPPQLASQPFSVSQPHAPPHHHAQLLLASTFPQSAPTQATAPQQQQASAAQQQQQQQFQRLKVEDALSYLDQVKLQFGNQPQVYNDFLDIMKEFKSQSIDTPGVIGRVSSLFKGHPDLIMGFNTFLPPGYKIEVISNEPVQVITSSAVHSKPLASSQQQVSISVGGGGASGGSGPMSQTGYNALSVAVAAQNVLHSQAPQQPVEFNHAINYVNKIKNRFQARPDTYKAFLEILHAYQKDQRTWRDGTGAPKLSESEVYHQVAKLFQNDEDLLQEFGQFLPEATAHMTAQLQQQQQQEGGSQTGSVLGGKQTSSSSIGMLIGQTGTQRTKTGTISSKPRSALKRGSGSGASMITTHKKLKSNSGREVSLAEAGKHGSFNEYQFFDKVRRAMRSQELYENFLRCLALFNQEIINRTELVQLVTPFLGKFPDLFHWFKTFLGYKETPHMDASLPVGGKERGSELAAEIDFRSCKRCGASYRALPMSYQQPKCSGRTAEMAEVLNDTWVSFPSWSEDSTFITSRKTQYEEYIYRCEDERFELDVVLETNRAAIRCLEGVAKQLSRMSSEEAGKFKLDSTLGGNSEVIQRKAIQRIYGDKAPDIIDGLKKTPSVAVPIVLRRLRAKEEEWRDAQKQFNKIWREQLEKYYLKSLDHQGINFKTTDHKTMRVKSLLNEIETLFDDRQEQIADGAGEISGPHMTFTYPDKMVLDDAAGLVVHHLKRQTSVHSDDKRKIKEFMYHFVPDIFDAQRGDLSDCEDGDEDAMETEVKPQFEPGPGSHSLMFGNNTFYVFFRLHQMLCERLFRIYRQAVTIAETEAPYRQLEKDSTAVALRLRALTEIDVEEYYPAFLDMVKNLLDGNMDPGLFEDTCREMFGVHAYIGFTMDKLIQNIVRQLHNLVTDEICVKVYDMLVEESVVMATAGNLLAAEAAYQKRAEQLLAEENCFKIMINKRDAKLEIELIEGLDDERVSAHSAELEKWANYVEKYFSSEQVEPSEKVKNRMLKRPVVLLRNVRSSEIRWIRSRKIDDDDEERTPTPSIMDGVISLGNLEAKVESNSYKLKFVAGSNATIFRPEARKVARQNFSGIKSRKLEKFDAWYDSWAEENVSEEQQKTCFDWLRGKGIAGNFVTRCQTHGDRTRYITMWKKESIEKSEEASES